MQSQFKSKKKSAFYWFGLGFGSLIVFLMKLFYGPITDLGLHCSCFLDSFANSALERLFYRTPANTSFCFIDFAHFFWFKAIDPANISLFKVDNRNSTKGWEICWKLTINITERRHRRRSGALIVNLKHISHFFLVFLLLSLSRLLFGRARKNLCGILFLIKM